jgi:hypothetical protein
LITFDILITTALFLKLLYRVFNLKCSHNYYSLTPSHSKQNQWHPYPVVAADALLGISMAIILAVLLLNEHFCHR